MVANGLVLRAGAAYTDLPAPYLPGAPGPVVVPAGAAVAATFLYARLERTADRVYARFRRLLAVGLLVSFGPILAAAVAFDVALPGVVLLATQHVAVAAVLAAAFVPRRRASIPAGRRG